MRETVSRSAALTFFFITVVAPLGSSAHAPFPRDGEDILCLADGRVFDGLTLQRSADGVTLKLENGDIFVPEALVRDALIASEPEFIPRTGEERDMFAKGRVPFDGKWVSPKRRRDGIAKRADKQRAAIAEMQKHRNWGSRYRHESKHFKFEYTVPQHIFEGFRDKMEAYFTVFAKDWKVKQSRKQPKLNVSFYGTRKEFMRTGGAGPSTLGYFMFVGDYDLNIFFDRLSPAETEAVMFHEANHYLQKLINEEFSYPHWPGEALAEFYGASRYDEKTKKLETGLLQEGRLTDVKTDIAGGEYIGLRKLITTERMYEHYSWGWTLVHFLMHDKRYGSKFKKFFVELANGRNVERYPQHWGKLRLLSVRGEEVFEVFKRSMGLKSDAAVAKLENEWHGYIDELETQSAHGFALAAASAVRTDRPIRAKRLFAEAVAADSTSPAMYHRYAELLRDEDEVDEAIMQWEKAIELDPLTARFYYDLGRVLTKTDAAESKRLIGLAKELDPDVASSY